MKLARLATLFVAAYVVWLLFVFPYDPARESQGAGPWDVQSILLGLAAAALATLMLRNVYVQSPAKFWNPVRWFWALIYVPLLGWEILKANLNVAYVVLHPDMPIRPGIVKVKTTLRSESGRTALANSITLTPGTFTVDVKPETGEMFIHWLAVEVEDVEGATERIVRRFEAILRKVFD